MIIIFFVISNFKKYIFFSLRQLSFTNDFYCYYQTFDKKDFSLLSQTQNKRFRSSARKIKFDHI